MFDRVTYDVYMAVIYAFRPPTPPNAALELGLAKTLAVYREWAGELADGGDAVLLNDRGGGGAVRGGHGERSAGGGDAVRAVAGAAAAAPEQAAAAPAGSWCACSSRGSPAARW